MQPWLDGSLYPDVEPPTDISTLEDRIDFLARLCSAWDFGILPELETIDEIRRPIWYDAIEACQLLTSPTYHLVRAWHHLPEAPYLGQELAYIRDDPNLAYI
jgi:hypothetical protein